MKWYIDLFLSKFFSIFKKVCYFVLKFLWLILSIFCNFFYRHFLVISGYVNYITKPLQPYISLSLIWIFEFFLTVLLVFPKQIYVKFLRQWVNGLYTKYKCFLNNYKFVQLFLGFLNIWFKHIINYFSMGTHFVIKYLWKVFIDFLFFDLYRNKGIFFKHFKKYSYFIVKFFILYLFFYKNFWILGYNYFLIDNIEDYVVWDRSSITGIKNLFISSLNIDNLFLLFYLIFFKLGIFNLIYLDFNTITMLVGLQWVNFYELYKVNNPNFSFIKQFVDYVLYNFYIPQSMNLNVFDFDSTPIFFYFGFFFFLTVVLSWFFFSYLGLYGIYKLNLVSLFLFWLSLLFSAKSIFVNQKVYIIKMCSWIFLSPNVKVDFFFLIDTISFSFMLLTTTIAFFVFIYAFSYFRYEPLVDRFLLFILSFVISMLFLVASGNTIMLFLGWELIGFTSFCLINFWTTKAATLKSAFKAFTFNKISDFYMFMFLVTTYSVYYTFDILALNTQVQIYKTSVIYLFGTPISFLEFIALMIIGAAFIKSAQLGGHAWLPDSMEAPVPASSLIHSATLVSAGVYLILRFNFIFDATQFSKFIIPVIGSLTAAYGGVCAVAQSDLKKTLAYSTISHCGFLMVLCATEMNEFTILYLYVHGFFKAGVFMCVGNVLRITKGYQDNRRMGGLLKYLPFEYFCAVVGVLNLAGLPFTFGFFIKHLLLSSLETHIYIYYFVIFNSFIGAFAGLFYSYRLITYTFNDFKKGNKALYINLNRVNYNSKFYTNSSVAATLSIFFLFVSAYVITYFLFKYFIINNFNFSDYMNTTILTNYYSIVNSYNGYLLNFSYINVTVIVVAMSLFFSKYRKVPRVHLILKILSYICLFILYVYLFYMFI